MLYLSEIQRLLEGRLVHAPIEVPISGVCTDSRRVRKGDLFVAIRGKRHDGHAFAMEAITKGAGALLVERRMPFLKAQLIVGDTVVALGRLAAAYRMALRSRVIAVTGSNGKTTTKEMISHILASRGTVVKAPASYNNRIGLPLTILKATPESDFLVLEVGASRKGEIAELGGIARPDAAIVTNIAPAHLEGFRTMNNVAREKLSLLNHVRSGGFAVLNADDPAQARAARERPARIFKVGLHGSRRKRPDWLPEEVHEGNGVILFRVRGVPVQLNVFGLWNVTNALQAIAVCTRFGVSLQQCAERLATFRPPRMRMEKLTLDGVTILNDAYNSNPVSAENALREFSKLPATGEKVVVLGDMAELGPMSRRAHRRLGESVRDCPGIGRVIAVGGEIIRAVEAIGDAKPVRYFHDVHEAADYLFKSTRPGDQVLLKASRIVGLEQILEDWVRREPRVWTGRRQVGA